MFKEFFSMMFWVVVAVLVVRTFFFQPFHIPSASMRPTLVEGDHLFVSKFAYGFGNYSFPVRVNWFNSRFLGKVPERGDVVVFHTNGIDYIKRVIGLPGDRIQLKKGTLFLNGSPVAKEYFGKKAAVSINMSSHQVPVYQEKLMTGKTYKTLDTYQNSSGDNTQIYYVPEGHFFVLGDNRDNSSDSRFSAPVGFIPFGNLIGRAEIIYFSKLPNHQSWLSKIRWPRLLKWIS